MSKACDPDDAIYSNNQCGAPELTNLNELDEGSELSRRSRVAYDCKHGLTRVLSLETYLGPMATGKIIVSVQREGHWKEVPTSTAYETGFKTVCAK